MGAAWRCRVVAASFMVMMGAGCLLTTSLDGLVTADERADSGSGAADAARADVSPPQDAAPLPDATVAVASCDALKQKSPGTPDGVQLIDPDGAGPLQAFEAYCDMTSDGGGWMLVTAAMLGEETNVLATVTRQQDARGGVILRVYVNAFGCGQSARTRHRIFIEDRPAWTRVRLTESFAGNADCWHIFGGQEGAAMLPLDPNLVPFAKTDVIRDAIRMGGANGDAFDGITNRCDGTPANFWEASNGPGQRSATVILRRRDLGAPSGLETGADCGGFGPGDTSSTWWEYRNVYVK